MESLKFTQEDWPGKKEALEQEEKEEKFDFFREKTTEEKLDSIKNTIKDLRRKIRRDHREQLENFPPNHPEAAKEFVEKKKKQLEAEEDAETTDEESSEEPFKSAFSKQTSFDIENQFQKRCKTQLQEEIETKTQELKELKRINEAKKLDSSRKRKLSKLLDEMGASEDEKMVVNWILQKGYAQTRMTEFVMSDIDHDLIKKP